jgi:hypothetical protein
MLICKKCGREIKTLKDFTKPNLCNLCYNIYMRKYYNENFKSDFRITVNNKTKNRIGVKDIMGAKFYENSL